MGQHAKVKTEDMGSRERMKAFYGIQGASGPGSPIGIRCYGISAGRFYAPGQLSKLIVDTPTDMGEGHPLGPVCLAATAGAGSSIN